MGWKVGFRIGKTRLSVERWENIRRGRKLCWMLRGN